MSANRLEFRGFLVAGLLAGVAVLAGCGADAPAEEAVRPALVAQPGAAGAAVQAFPGEVRARHEPVLAFRIGGKVAKRLVDVGDRVEAGQALAELDAADVALQLEGARAQLASAEADLALADAELERHRVLYEQQIVSKSLYDTRVSAQQAAAARVRQARAQASVSGNQATYAVLRAPAAGVIAQRQAEAGQVVAAGQAVFVLAQDGEREVAISLPEQVARDYAPGREMQVELGSRPGQRVPGRLREIAPAADPQARTFAARVEFDAADGTGGEIGQSARVYAAAEGDAVVSVPLSALYRKDDVTAVWVLDPATSAVSLRPVRTGPFGEDGVPVIDGLGAQDWIVVAGVHLLREGQRVRPVDRQNRPVELAAPAVAAD